MIEGPEDGVCAKQFFSEHASKHSLYSSRSTRRKAGRYAAPAPENMETGDMDDGRGPRRHSLGASSAFRSRQRRLVLNNDTRYCRSVY